MVNADLVKNCRIDWWGGKWKWIWCDRWRHNTLNSDSELQYPYPPFLTQISIFPTSHVQSVHFSLPIPRSLFPIPLFISRLYFSSLTHSTFSISLFYTLSLSPFLLSILISLFCSPPTLSPYSNLLLFFFPITHTLVFLSPFFTHRFLYLPSLPVHSPYPPFLLIHCPIFFFAYSTICPSLPLNHSNIYPVPHCLVPPGFFSPFHSFLSPSYGPILLFPTTFSLFFHSQYSFSPLCFIIFILLFPFPHSYIRASHSILSYISFSLNSSFSSILYTHSPPFYLFLPPSLSNPFH